VYRNRKSVVTSSLQNSSMLRTVLTPFRSRRMLSSITEAKTDLTAFNLFNPTQEHASLREMLRSFVEAEVDPQALEYNRKEKFNKDLFKKLGTLGLLGITVPVEHGGSGMDAVAACIAHGSYLDIY
jgi:isovaleryl-CoA dehydrogenase